MNFDRSRTVQERASVAFLVVLLGCVALAAPAAALVWQYENVSVGGTTHAFVCGRSPGFAVDAACNPHVLFTRPDSTNAEGRTATYGFRDTSGWHFSDVGAGYAGPLCLDSGGRPHVFYQQEADSITPTYAFWNGSGWQSQALRGELGAFVAADDSFSAAIDSRDRIHLVYSTGSTSELRYSVSNETGLFNKSLVETLGTGYHGAIALDGSDRPRVAYEANRNDKIYAFTDESGWHQETIDTVSSAQTIAIAVDSGGRPHVVYDDMTAANLRYATREVSGWDIEPLPREETCGWFPSLVLDVEDRPHFAFLGGGFLTYARRDASGWYYDPIEAEYSTHPSLVLDRAGRPHIFSRVDESYDTGPYVYRYYLGNPDGPPTASDDAYNAVAGRTLAVAAPGVLANDTGAEGATLTAVLVDGPGHGVLDLGANGSFVYSPDTDFAGTDTFTYLASDGQAESEEATVRIAVVPPATPTPQVTPTPTPTVSPTVSVSTAPTPGGDPTMPYGYVDQWGEEGSGAGQFSGPGFITVDGAGNVYVIDSGNSRIQKFAPDGAFLATWGEGGHEEGQYGLSPGGIAVDAGGNVYVVDVLRGRLQKFTPTGQLVAEFETYPSWGNIAVDGAGNIYQTGRTHDVEKFSPVGEFITGWDIGDGYSTLGGIAVDAVGNVYAVDSTVFEGKVLKYTPSGTLITSWGFYGDGDGIPENGEFEDPNGITVDAAGYIYVVDSGGNRVQKFTATGAFVSWWGTRGHGEGEFDEPSDIAVDATGYAYVSDSGNNRIQKFAPAPIPPRASFRSNVTSGVAPFPVEFVDTSVNMPTAWNWDFGDGTGASIQHPVHTYQSPGNYTVRLTATSRFGSNTSTAMVRGLRTPPYVETVPSDGSQIPLDATITIITCFPGTVSESTVLAKIKTSVLQKRDTGQIAVSDPVNVTETVRHFTSWGVVFATEVAHRRSYPDLEENTSYDLYYDGNVIARYTTGTGLPVLALPGGADKPVDMNGDGLYDDVNGNGRKDFADVVLFFNQMTWIADHEPVEAFDYNNNGRIDFADVVWLFNHL